MTKKQTLNTFTKFGLIGLIIQWFKNRNKAPEKLTPSKIEIYVSDDDKTWEKIS